MTDEVRDFWDRRPCNIGHGMSPVGTAAYFEEVDRRRYFVEPHILSFADFERWRGKRVLEVGCGIGTDAVRFARAGAYVTAVDVSERSLDLARQNVALRVPADCHGVVFHKVSAENLSSVVRAGDYDLVYSFGVLHHTPDTERALVEIRECLAPVGEMRAMLYAKVSTKSLAITLGLAQPEAQAGCPIAKTYTVAEARRLVEDAGLVVDRIDKAHIFPWDVSEYVGHHYVKLAPWRWMTDSTRAEIARYIGWHLLVRARSRD